MMLAPTQGDRDVNGSNFSHNHDAFTSQALPDVRKGPANMMNAIDKQSDYHNQLQQVTKINQSCILMSDESFHQTTINAQTPHMQIVQSQLDSQWAPRKQFSWKQGFLYAHKPPTRRLTQPTKSSHHHPSVKKEPINTSCKVLIIDFSPTMA